MDPKVVTGGKFAVQWTHVYNTNEVFYAKPLVYTPSGYPNELVILVSNQNILRIVDGLTGALVNSKVLEPPFQSVDSDCGDIPNTIGITGTPIIDPATDNMFFFAKGYKDGWFVSFRLGDVLIISHRHYKWNLKRYVRITSAHNSYFLIPFNQSTNVSQVDITSIRSMFQHWQLTSLSVWRITSQIMIPPGEPNLGLCEVLWMK